MKKNAFMISAMKSGSGKTLITLGLANLLKRAGKSISMFKTGPDYIDTMYHSKITNSYSTNLDPFFLEPNSKPGELKKLFLEHMTGDIGIVEGAMGLFDGVYKEGKRGSACVVSEELNIDVILVVEAGETDCLSEYLSRYSNRVRAVIVNKVRDLDISLFKNKVENLGLKFLGYLYDNDSFHIESRHLGLFEPQENIQTIINAVSNELLKSLEPDFFLDFKLKVSISSKALKNHNKKYRIAYAFDKAFSFTYNTNIEILKEYGFEIVKFSPLNDKNLPENVDVIWLSGGYPEIYAKELSENRSMLNSIKQANEAVIIAECGGFIYLHESFTDIDGNYYQGAGVIKGKAFKTEKLVRFGYIDIESKKDNILLKKNQKIRSHEFHYYDSTDNGDSCHAIKANKSKEWDCIHSGNSIFAGFPHLYLRGYEFMIENLIDFLEVTSR